MYSIRTLLLLLFLGLISLSYSKLQIASPSSLLKGKLSRHKNGIDYAVMSPYLKIPFEGSFRGRLILANPSLDACSSIKSIPTSGPNSVANPIILANWGGCHYSEKMRNAELAGARMLILILNPTESLESSAIQLAIQSPLEILTITYKDGMDLMSALDESQKKPAGDPESVIEMVYSYDPKKVQDGVKSDVAYLNYWFVTNDASKASYDLLSDLQGVLSRFGSAIKFSPNYVLWEDVRIVRDKQFVQDTRCVSGGRYCDAIGDFSSGSDAVLEALRQICLRDLDKDQSTPETNWWKYMTSFANECVGTNKPNCHQKAFEMANIPGRIVDKVNACIRESFGASADENFLETFNDNTKLRDEVNELHSSNIYDFPSLYVNGWKYAGSMRNMTTLTEFICKNFYSDKAPSVCTGRVPYTMKDYSVYGGVLLGSALVMALVLFCVRRSVQRQVTFEVNNEIPNIVSRYRTFRDESDSVNTGDNIDLENSKI